MNTDKAKVKTVDIINAFAETPSLEDVATRLDIPLSDVENVVNRWFVEIRNVQEKNKHN